MTTPPATFNALLQTHIGPFRRDTPPGLCNGSAPGYATLVHRNPHPAGRPVRIDDVLAIIDAYDDLTYSRPISALHKSMHS